MARRDARIDPSAGKRVVKTDQAPPAIGPYSQAVITNGFVFAAGQIALDPGTAQLVPGDVRIQTKRVLENLSAVLAAAGSSMEKVVKTTVFLRDLNDFGPMNEIYGEYFRENPPARSTVQVAKLPRDAAVEIEVVALA
jgi:2-iminobutanoate/2-iminopropanoate deaminase